MQLFTHLLSSYLQGMGDFFSALQIMGIAMLLLSANYSVHFFFGIRFKNADSAILMNMSTYFQFGIDNVA